MARKIGTSFPTLNSFVFAFCVYVGVIFALFYKVSQVREVVKFTDSRDAFMDVLIAAPLADEFSQKSEEKAEFTDDVKTTNKATTLNSPSLAAEFSQKSEPSLKELFESTQNLTQSNKKSGKEAVKSASELFDELKKNEKAPRLGARGEFDEFKGTVSRIISQIWQSYQADTNNVANVDIFIDKNGKFSYNINSLSYDKDFNAKVREVLNRLSETPFPRPPSGKTQTLNFNFIDEIGEK